MLKAVLKNTNFGWELASEAILEDFPVVKKQKYSPPNKLLHNLIWFKLN